MMTLETDLASTASGKGAGKIGFAQNASYASETVGSHLQNFICIADAPFNAVGDGVADDTASIQMAIDYITGLGKGGGRIFFPIGTYRITSQLSITYPMILEGEEGGTVIAPNFATGRALFIHDSAVSDGGITVRGMIFKASVTRTADAIIECNNAYYVTIESCKFVSSYIGIKYTGPGTTGFFVRACNFSYCTGHCIYIEITTGSQGPADVILEDLWLLGTSPTSQPLTGIYLASAGDITLRHVSTVWCRNGLFIAPTVGIRVQSALIDECFFDSGTGYGIYCAPNGGTVDLLKVVNTWCATNGGGGIYLGGSSAIKQVDLINVVSSNNALDGFHLTPASSNVSIIGCTASANGTSGILVDAGTSNFKVVGCTIGPTGEFSGNAGYGILIQPGGSDNYIISQNKIMGNAVAQLFDGGTGSHKTLYPNVGIGTAITPNAVPNVDWGIDFATRGAVAIPTSGSYNLSVGSGLVMLHSDSTGAMGMFMCFAGSVVKVAGSSAMVAGPAGANQIGVSYFAGSGVYQISNGFSGVQNVFISTIKTRSAS